MDRFLSLEPFRVLSVMVNATCNLRCKHCDLPRRYTRYEHSLSPKIWGELIDTLIVELKPWAVTISAMEPLLPDGSQEKSTAIMRSALRHGVRAGFVTNGMFAADFLADNPLGSALDFLDISFEGPPEVNDRIRGQDHRARVESFLSSQMAPQAAHRLYISTTLTRWNSDRRAIMAHVDWVLRWAHPPRLVFIPVYPNEHVDTRLPILPTSFEPTLEQLIKESTRCEEMFLELFPSSLPDLADLIERRMLPGPESLAQDQSGMLWGHVAENLYIRFNNNALLRRYNLRISPEGHALPPDSPEVPDYLSNSAGNLRKVQLSKVRQCLGLSDPLVELNPECRSRDCAAVCQGENGRCKHLIDKTTPGQVITHVHA